MGRKIIAVLLVLFSFAVNSSAISDKFPKLVDDLIPVTAELISQGCGWSVYKEETEPTELYTACRLYLQNNNTWEQYILLETQGEKQGGWAMPIKARNIFAYGNGEDRHEKHSATYEYGYISAVDEVFIISQNLILVSGVPDARNYYNYLINLDTCSAVHFEAYDKYIQTVIHDGRALLEFYSYAYTSEGRQTIKVWYTLDGNLSKTSMLDETSHGRHRMVFYMWDVGDPNPDGEKSRTGHAFVYIPEIGYVGYGGVVFDHSRHRASATDSCAVYISDQQLAAVKDKLREWQQFTPEYILADCDCTSFAMDIADAAGIEYGMRVLIQFPSAFIRQLKKYNR